MLRNLCFGFFFVFMGSLVMKADVPPVEFVKLCVFERGKTINLIWETALEINNNYFLIERSGDGNNYKVIGQIQGNGTVFEKKIYEFEDDAPIEGLSYYRIKQIDFNGEFSFSDVMEVENFMKIEAEKLSLFPNPSAPFDITLLVSSDEPTDYWTVYLKGLNGQNIGKTLITGSGKHSLRSMCETLENGFYFFQIQNKHGEMTTQRVFIYN